MIAAYVVIFITFACHWQGTSTLRCATCASDKSAEDCRNSMQLLDCRSILNRCQTLYYKTTTTVLWKKGCTAGSNCSPRETCPLSHDGCTVDCCTSDNCNNSQHIQGSMMWITIGTILTIVYLCF